MSNSKPSADYGLYLVTDSTPAILRDRSLVDVVKEALEGGVTIVQYRDKKSDTGALIAQAKELHALTMEYGVPLLINDRLDVALAVGCEGIHIGQDDMALTTARSLLGDNKIIGVSVSTVDEAIRACEDGADYLGIGAVFSTATKDAKTVLGTAGVQNILSALSPYPDVKTVCIGGINATTAPRVKFQSVTPEGKCLDGYAIVSAIVGAEDPRAAARELHEILILGGGPAPHEQAAPSHGEERDVLRRIQDFIKAVDGETPLSHNMTNLVVQNFAANVALAVGASPIMANYGEEATDLAKLGGSLVVNMGTVTPEGLENYAKALRAYNPVGGPVVFDPVGAGATSIRREAVKYLLASGYIDIIKGNEGEILTIEAVTRPSSPTSNDDNLPQQRGVDSSSTLTTPEKARIVTALARRHRCVVVMTGKSDIASAGETAFAVSSGNEMMGRVTGTGCVLGTTISAFVGTKAGREDKLGACLAALVFFGVAGERAAARDDVRGPGTFVPAFIDELYRMRKESVEGDMKWLEMARLEWLRDI